MKKAFSLVIGTAAMFAASGTSVFGFGAYGTTGLAGGFRWDAAPRTMSGWERSLNGGLRYSLQGGSWQAYRDSFTWSTLPTVNNFQTAVQSAIALWNVTDPASGLGTTISFVEDLSTPVSLTIASGIRQGAEIDLFAHNFGDTSLRADTFFNALSGTVTLTSGTVGYAAGPISGADVRMNSNGGAAWNLQAFLGVMHHEIGHARPRGRRFAIRPRRHVYR
ncbi:MAG TPA: hypothetical protein VIT91_20135 [Chthoniobacterales bacterium]